MFESRGESRRKTCRHKSFVTARVQNWWNSWESWSFDVFDCRVCGLRTEMCGYKEPCQDLVKLRLLNLLTNITKLRKRLNEILTNTN